MGAENYFGLFLLLYLCVPLVWCQTCQNSNPHCVRWSQSGECEKNPAFMLQNCQVSCPAARCQKPQCVDNSQCPQWLRHGPNECETNPRWMHTNCPVSCGVCGAVQRQPAPVLQQQPFTQPAQKVTDFQSNVGFVPRLQNFPCDGTLSVRYNAMQGWGFPAILCNRPFFRCHCSHPPVF